MTTTIDAHAIAYMTDMHCYPLDTIDVTTTLYAFDINPATFDEIYGQGAADRLITTFKRCAENYLAGLYDDTATIEDVMLVASIMRKFDLTLAPTDAAMLTERMLDDILSVSEQLSEAAGPQAPYASVYRINDCAEYVSEADWDAIWAHYPSWWKAIWMLADNGQFTRDELIGKTIGELLAFYHSDAFEPEFAYYTELDEDGID